MPLTASNRDALHIVPRSCVLYAFASDNPRSFSAETPSHWHSTIANITDCRLVGVCGCDGDDGPTYEEYQLLSSNNDHRSPSVTRVMKSSATRRAHRDPFTFEMIMNERYFRGFEINISRVYVSIAITRAIVFY